MRRRRISTTLSTKQLSKLNHGIFDVNERTYDEDREGKTGRWGGSGHHEEVRTG